MARGVRTPADEIALAMARRRGPEAVARLQRAIDNRRIDELLAVRAERKRMMEDPRDLVWPPAFIRRTVKAIH